MHFLIHRVLRVPSTKPCAFDSLSVQASHDGHILTCSVEHPSYSPQDYQQHLNQDAIGVHVEGTGAVGCRTRGASRVSCRSFLDFIKKRWLVCLENLSLKFFWPMKVTPWERLHQAFHYTLFSLLPAPPCPDPNDVPRVYAESGTAASLSGKWFDPASQECRFVIPGLGLSAPLRDDGRVHGISEEEARERYGRA